MNVQGSSENKNALSGIAVLLVSALVFGMTFVFQKQASEHLGAAAIVTLRFCIGAVALGVIFVLCDFFRKRKGLVRGRFNKRVLLGGFLCGVSLFVASVAQQAGLETTTAGKAGFITAIYIVIVPVLGLLAGKRTRINVWYAVVVATAGFWLMSSIGDDVSVGDGDILVLAGSFCYALQILFIDEFADGEDPFRFAFAEFVTASVVGIPVMCVSGVPAPSDINAAIIPLLYMGLAASALGYGLQVVGQQKVNPATSTVLLSTESVVALLGGAIVLHESNSVAELGGCLLVFAGVFITQLQFGRRFLRVPRTAPSLYERIFKRTPVLF